MTMRIGQGFDVHRFSQDASRPLVLGGITVPGHRGLEGHSDADALTHAIGDALLGSCGLGDLGGHFPDTDDRFAGANSVALLTDVVAELVALGWSPINVDATLVAEQPKLSPYTTDMGELLAGVLGAPVSVKATRAEGLGPIGRVEGIAALAVVLVGRSS